MIKDWEKEFDSKFGERFLKGKDLDFFGIKQFIQDLLQQQQEEMVKEIEEDYIKHLLEATCFNGHIIDWRKAKEKAEVRDMQRWD